MASLRLCPQFEINLMSNRKVIELLLQFKSAKAHSRNYIRVKVHLVRRLLRNRLLLEPNCFVKFQDYATMKSVLFSTASALNADQKLSENHGDLILPDNSKFQKSADKRRHKHFS